MTLQLSFQEPASTKQFDSKLSEREKQQPMSEDTAKGVDCLLSVLFCMLKFKINTSILLLAPPIAIESLPESPPTLRSLTIIKWRDDQGQTQRYSVLSMISHKWRKIGTLCGLKHAQLESIWMKNLKDPEPCCIDILTKWMEDGSSYYAVSWEGLFELLGDLELPQVITDLQNALARRIDQLFNSCTFL